MKSDMDEIARYTDLVIQSEAPDLNIPADACLNEKTPDPCIIMIVGATGDLTMRKLVPALHNLFRLGGLPDRCVVLGASRSSLTDEQFRERIRESIADSDQSTFDEFASLLAYQRIDLSSQASYDKLAARLKELDQSHGTQGNRILYLAIPPSAYTTTVKMLGSTGLAEEGRDGRPWSRIVVEKPFGWDLQSSEDLDRALHEHFREHQIFRIDHYLAKETVQNVLLFRFANSIFEPLWNRMFIDHVEITATESLGVENRVAYYEEAGVIRDMFQNHMLQLMALVAMEPPPKFSAEYVRDEKAKVLRSLRPLSEESPLAEVVLGQYGAGRIDGERVRGYREIDGVPSDSCTPTFALMKLSIDNWRWQGVPFYVKSGKALREKLTEIVIHFKEPPDTMFDRQLAESIQPNALRLGIYPKERINLTFQTKNPGAVVCLRSVTMNFNYTDNYSGPSVDAYEKALLDAMQGDQTLFLRQDAVRLAWSFLMPMLKECERRSVLRDRLVFYPAGSDGPEDDVSRLTGAG